jgi:ABC-2 type transport system ATP-binding protein
MSPAGKGTRMTGPDVPDPARPAGGLEPAPGEPGAFVAPTAGVHARGLRRSFGPVLAVQGIDLDAAPGQVTALVGPNGAGKTTAILVLATLLKPDAGEVRVAGFDPITQAGAVRARMGWSPDVFGLYDNLTCREYLEVMAAAYAVPKRSRRDRASYLLGLARLPEKADEPVHSLSRGQKQRLGLVRALVHDPGVLLLDEPASGLDPRSRVELRDLLRRLAGEGRAVVVSSHILSDLEEVADRVVFVDGGRTVGQHAIGELPSARSIRTYRLRALDSAALRQALERAGVGWVEAGHAGIDVEVLGGEPSAARLLGELVAAGVAVTAFAPLGGALEATYLDLVEGQR